MADFARMHGGAHLLVGVVVIGAHSRVVEEREQFAAVATQAFDEAFGVGIVEG